MPALTLQTIRSLEPKAFTQVALDGTDSFPFSGDRDFLLLENTSGSSITLTLLGDQATTVNREGITQIDVSGGKSVPVPANSFVIVDLVNAAAYLRDSNNMPDINGGTSNISASLFRL